MTIISQIENRGAAVAWSPISSYADCVALGAKDSGGIGFDDYGGELEIYDSNATSTGDDNGDSSNSPIPRPKVLGSVKTTSRFASIGWSPMPSESREKFPMGLIAGGMVDGTVIIWDPAKILRGDPSIISTIPPSTPSSPITALQFNPHSTHSHQLSTGSSSGTLSIHSLSTPFSPTTTTLTTTTPEITSLAWNSQVPHILAAASTDGTVTVYDTKQKKPWSSIRTGANCTSIGWNPTEGLHLVTASGDDRTPVMKLWDLRASTTMPLATLSGHESGVLSLAWCPQDASLLVSCGKDNRTLLWDLFSLKVIYEVPNESGGGGGEGGMFGGGAGQQKRYDVKWSPLRRGVLSTCSFDRKVQTHGMIGAATRSGRVPKWLKRPCGVSCGFGGSVVSFGSGNRTVTVDTIVEEAALKDKSTTFEQSIASNDYLTYCSQKAKESKDPAETRIWAFMQIIFASNAREQLLQYLGYNPQQISSNAQTFSEDKTKSSPSIDALSLKDSTPPMSPSAETLVKNALIVGNFEAAVECCFRSGNLADGLILASCGGAELWAKTQKRYFEAETAKRPYLGLVGAVIHNQLTDLVSNSDPGQWQETLAIVSTYGKADEFPALCLALGDLLEGAGDEANASLCYMCALAPEKAVKYWKSQLEKATKKLGSVDINALHTFVERVAVFLQAVDPNTVLDESVAGLFTDYAKILAEQGLLVTAAKYCRGESSDCNELRDRLFRGPSGSLCRQYIISTPPNPFANSVTVTQPRVNARQQPQQQQSQTGYQQQQQQSHMGYQQQQQQSQQQYYQQQQQQVAPQPPKQATQSQLPPGWVALQDPASGMTYYANQNTGETTWEKPAPVQPLTPAPTPAAPSQQPQQQPSYNTNGHYQQQQPTTSTPPQQQQQQATTTPVTNGAGSVGSKTGSGAKLASKYGDGFVSSASHPELAQQYGNHGTSNPYKGAQRPGTAATPVTSKQHQQPSQADDEPISLTSPPPLPPSLQPTVDTLLQFISHLKSTPPTSPVEQKQLAEVEKGVAVLIKKLAKESMEEDVIEKLKRVVSAVGAGDFGTAGAVQTSLVNSDWREHKDWLKGMKFLIQLGAKRRY